MNIERESSREYKYPEIGIYEHYKSTPESRKYYQVLGFARHTETEEILVVYIPLYTDSSHTGPRFQVRPIGMFTENITRDGEEIPRFKYIGQET